MPTGGCPQPDAPLAAASRRLRKNGGRPRIHPVRPPVDPALLGMPALGLYLDVSPDAARDLVARGVFPRVRIPGPNGRDLDRVLVRKADVDRAIDSWTDILEDK